MSNAFTLWAELRSDSQQFERSMQRAGRSADDVTKSVYQTQKAVEASGKTSATVSRQFDKLNQTLADNKTKLRDAAQAFQQGAISARQMATVFNQVEKSTAAVSSRLKDLKARMQDVKSGNLFGNNQILAGITGGFAGAGIAGSYLAAFNATQKLASATFDLGKQSVQAAADFQQTRKAMELYAGSAVAAEQDLASLADLSRKTPGLGLEDAEKGALRLKAMGFQAQVVNDLLIGLSKQKILSGAGSEAIDRVTTNLAQLASGGGDLQDIKELVQNLPTVRKEINLLFGSLEGFKSAIVADPQGAIKKLADQLKNVNAPAGGANDALQKLNDTFLQIGRDFGTPILDPLTEGVKDLTKFLTENRAGWKQWGQSVADEVQGSFDLVRGGQAVNRASGGWIGRILGEGASQSAGQQIPLVFRVLASGLELVGAESRRADEALDKFMKTSFPLLKPGMMRDDFTVDFDALSAATGAPKTRDFGPSQKERDQQERDALSRYMDATKARQKVIENAFSVQNATMRANFSVQEAMLQGHLSKTEAGEVESIKRLTQLKNQQLRDQLAAEKQYYTALIMNAATGEEAQGYLAQLQQKTAQINGEIASNTVKSYAQIQAKIKEAKKELSSIFAELYGANNPFVQIFTQGEAAIERIREATKGLGAELRNYMVGLSQANTQRQMFEQGIQNRLAALGYRQQAELFKNGSLEEQARRMLFPNYFTQAGRENHYQRILKQLTENEARNSFEKQVKAVTNGVAIDRLPAEQQASAYKAIAEMGKTVDRSRLSQAQKDLITKASIAEAGRLEAQEEEEREIRRQTLDVLKQLNGNKELNILIDDPNQRTSNGGTSANVKARYKQ